MKTKHPPRAFDTFALYLATLCASCPEPFPDGFAHHMAGVWLAQGAFLIGDKATMPSRTECPAFWQGFDSVKV